MPKSANYYAFIWVDIVLTAVYIYPTFYIKLIYLDLIWEVNWCLDTCIKVYIIDMMFGKEICGGILSVINMNDLLEI